MDCSILNLGLLIQVYATIMWQPVKFLIGIIVNDQCNSQMIESKEHQSIFDLQKLCYNENNILKII